MKILFLAITCIAAIVPVSLHDNRPSNSLRTKEEPAKVTEKVEQDPVEPEWDPRTQGIGDLVEGPVTEVSPGKRKPLKIEGRLFTANEFAAFIKSQLVPKLNKQDQWKPKFIVLHHTGIPSIKQRPNGFTTDNMHGLADYYGVKKGWKSGPHLFVDQHGIWLFTALDRRGTHSPSWNAVAWGIEQLGDFTKEDYVSGPGEKIRDNAIAAIAILSIAAKLDINTLHFHLEDPRTTHKSCPGPSCKKDEVIAKLGAEVAKWRQSWPSLGQ